MKRMRMAFLSLHSSPVGKAGSKDTGGMSTYLRGLSGALGEMGHEVDLFTRANGPDEAEVQQLSPGVRLVAIDDGSGLLAKNELYSYLPRTVSALKQFNSGEENRYDLVFSHYWLSASAGRELSQHWRIPHLVMFHTLGRAKNDSCSQENEPGLRLAEEEKLAHSSDLVIAAAPLEKERIVSYYALSPNRVAVIPCGVDRRLFRPLDRSAAKKETGLTGERIILAIGRIEPVKGYDLLIKAVGLLPREDKVNLVIVGGDKHSKSQVENLQKLATDSDFTTHRLIFPGIVEHHHLPLYYNTADLTVIPSTYESFGLVALESIACGTPLITGRTGIFPELLHPFTKKTPENLNGCEESDCATSPGFYLENRNPSAWAEAIRSCYLHNSAPLEPSIINHILAPYNWQAAASSFSSLIKNLLKQ